MFKVYVGTSKASKPGQLVNWVPGVRRAEWSNSFTSGRSWRGSRAHATLRAIYIYNIHVYIYIKQLICCFKSLLTRFASRERGIALWQVDFFLFDPWFLACILAQPLEGAYARSSYECLGGSWYVGYPRGPFLHTLRPSFLPYIPAIRVAGLLHLAAIWPM